MEEYSYPNRGSGEAAGADNDYDAWHEAGHCAADLLLGGRPTMACMRGTCSERPDRAHVHQSRAIDIPDLFSITVLLGGPAAEEVRAEMRGHLRNPYEQEFTDARMRYLHLTYGRTYERFCDYNRRARDEAITVVELELEKLKRVFRQSQGLKRIANELLLKGTLGQEAILKHWEG